MLLLAQRPDARAAASMRAEPTTIAARRRSPTHDTRAARRAPLFGAIRRRGLQAVRDWSWHAPAAIRCSSRRSCAAWSARGVLVRDGRSLGVRAPACERSTCRPRCTACCCRASTGLPRRRGACCRRPPCSGAEFDAALLRAVASEPGSMRRGARSAWSQADLLQPRAGRRRWRFTHALLHEVVYQNLLLARRTELHQRAGRALEARAPARARPQRVADLEALGHHWSLSRRQGTRRALPAGSRRLGARASTPTTTPCATTSARLRTLADASERCADARDRAAARERLGRSAGADRAARRGAARIRARAGAALGDGGRDPSRAARLQRKIGGLHWEAGERERAAGLLRCRARAASARHRRPASSVRTCSRRWAASRFAPATTARAPSRWAERALPRPRSPDGRRSRSAQRCASAGLQHARRRARARPAAPPRRSSQIERSVALAEQHELLQAACRGYTNLGVLYASLDPPRSIETCLRGLETAQEGRRPRLPVAPVREPRGRLLRAHQSLRGRGHRGGATPPSTSTAGSACSTTSRCR